MAGARSSQLVAPVALTNAVATYYTVPALKVALVKSIWLYNTHTGAVIGALGIGSLAAGGGMLSRSLAVGAELIIQPGLVMTAGQTLVAQASVTGKLTLVVSGAVLDA